MILAQFIFSVPNKVSGVCICMDVNYGILGTIYIPSENERRIKDAEFTNVKRNAHSMGDGILSSVFDSSLDQ